MEPKVGVGVFVLNAEGKFILGHRKGSIGAGIVHLTSLHAAIHSTCTLLTLTPITPQVHGL